MAAEMAEFQPPFEEIQTPEAEEPGLDEARGKLLTVFTEPQRSLERVVKKGVQQARLRERMTLTLESGYRQAANEISRGYIHAGRHLENEVTLAQRDLLDAMWTIDEIYRDFIYDRNK